MRRLAFLPALVGAALLAVAAVSMACGGDDGGGAATPGGGAATPSSTTAPGVTPAAAEVRVDAKQDGQDVRLRRGGKLIVTLESNRTTGFAWKVADGATAVLDARFDNAYNAPNTGLIGAGGSETFTFTATSTGTATLRLTYERSFEPGVAPERTFTLRVRVE